MPEILSLGHPTYVPVANYVMVIDYSDQLIAPTASIYQQSIEYYVI